MAAQGQLQAAAKSAPFDGRHHGLDGGLDVVDHRYEQRPPHLGPKLPDVSPCSNNNAERWWGTDKANQQSFHTLAASKSLLCYVKDPSHCVTSTFFILFKCSWIFECKRWSVFVRLHDFSDLFSNCLYLPGMILESMEVLWTWVICLLALSPPTASSSELKFISLTRRT